MTPKLGESKYQNWRKHTKWKLNNCMSRPQNIDKPYSNPKYRPLGPQEVKNNPKIKSKSNIRIEGNIENESCLPTWVDPKTVIEPYSGPKTSPDNNDPKYKCQNSEIIENESCSTTWVNPKTFLNPILNPKIAHRAPKSQTTQNLSHI